MSRKGAIGLAWVGAIIAWLSRPVGGVDGPVRAMVIIGIILAIVGCIFWAKAKGRHWAFGFWGFLAPIGFLGVALLKDRSGVALLKDRSEEKSSTN